jgi:hypothetical protein
MSGSSVAPACAATEVHNFTDEDVFSARKTRGRIKEPIAITPPIETLGVKTGIDMTHDLESKPFSTQNEPPRYGVGTSNLAVDYVTDVDPDTDRPEREAAIWARAELLTRAEKAYCRNVGPSSIGDCDCWPSPSHSFTSISQNSGTYVVLASAHQIKAVYRLEPRGKLKRMKRWPAEIVGKGETPAEAA